MAVPRVSVIVPVRDRRVLLGGLLDALAAQSLADHEVIVVDDGSTDGSAALAREYAARDGRVRVLDGGGRGAVRARSIGVADAGADVLAFTDSDCVPAANWLERGLQHIAAGADVAQGHTEPTRYVQPLEHTVWVTEGDGLYPTCNVFYRRSAFEAAGGFDAGASRRLGFRPGRTLRDLGFGEDTLLGWRVRRAGRAVFAPDTIVHHHVFDADAVGAVRRAWNSGGFAVLVREVPELRRSFLRHRVVLGPGTRIPLYAAAALAVIGRRRAGLAAGATWALANGVLVQRGAGSSRRKLASFPIVLAVDAVTAASLVLGSIRARRMVL